MKKDIVILVDMDGVVADFEKGFLNEWKRVHQDLPFIPLKLRKTFYPRDEYPRELAEEIVLSKGFYRKLPPIKNSINAIKELNKNYNLFICTSPRSEYKFCIPEKLEWIDEYFGREWIKRLIITKDKTLIIGNYLIDNKPHVKGVKEPFWKQILYKQPYNNGTFTWNNYHERFDGIILSEYL